MMNAEMLNMIPEMVEKYDMEIENLGGSEVLNVKNMAALQADGMTETVRHMVKDIKEYLRNSGKPVKYTPAFVPPVDGLRQNVVTTWYQAEFYNRNGCLEKRCYLAVLVLGVSFNIYTIERNEDEIAALATLERDFVENHLNVGVPPLPEGSQSDADTIGFLQNDADIKPETVDLSKEKDLLASYKEICASIKQLEQQKEKISQRLMMQLGENLFGACDGFRVSYKPQTRRTFDAEKFKQHFPSADLNQFYKVSQCRILKITAEKKKEA